MLNSDLSAVLHTAIRLTPTMSQKRTLTQTLAVQLFVLEPKLWVGGGAKQLGHLTDTGLLSQEHNGKPCSLQSWDDAGEQDHREKTETQQH